MGEYRGGGSSGGGRMQEEEEDEGRDDRYRDKYRALKAQYRYIKRENELLAEEYESAQTKLKRLKMEKNVLLDRLMLRQGQPGGMVED
ncbi:hypothetical protein HK097_006728 [Rhizophlyctis rosea]|uniref:INO80 complex subunit E N-terminal domain-containing protein n=1 Tax=Rhizophlyctis rosea TaxID=64517 RepID=A0AAD5SEA9_9FUNG|nr:hypothetical protein HK097_006728 [Rhizophlyctis rosea]